MKDGIGRRLEDALVPRPPVLQAPPPCRQLPHAHAHVLRQDRQTYSLLLRTLCMHHACDARDHAERRYQRRYQCGFPAVQHEEHLQHKVLDEAARAAGNQDAVLGLCGNVPERDAGNATQLRPETASASGEARRIRGWLRGMVRMWCSSHVKTDRMHGETEGPRLRLPGARQSRDGDGLPSTPPGGIVQLCDHTYSGKLHIRHMALHRQGANRIQDNLNNW